MVKLMSRKKNRSKLGKNNFVDYLIIGFLSLLILVTLIPFMNMLAVSFSDNAAVLENRNMLFPKHFTFKAYGLVLTSKAIYVSFFMTIAITTVTVLVHMTITVLTGFVLSRTYLPYRRALMIFVLITMLFSGGLVPYYLVVSALGMIDSFWVLTIPGAVSAYSIFLMKNFIMQIPPSLEEAAHIDGAGPMQVLTIIIIPLSLPIIATLCLFCAVGKWNDWFTAYIFIKKEKILWPIQNVLQNIVVKPDSGNIGSDINMGDYSESFQKALIIVAMIPIIAIYPFVQKFFITGIYIGSVKE